MDALVRASELRGPRARTFGIDAGADLVETALACGVFEKNSSHLNE